MTGLALQIDGKWAVLDEDVSVSIEDNSPVWGDGNSFSLPFSLSVEANRHILGNSDQITGQSVYEVLDGKRAVLYTLGIPVYYGKIKMDDEVEIADGYVDVTLVSGNLTFDEMIDGMNCQDVELMDNFEIGTELRGVRFTFDRTESEPSLGSTTISFDVSVGVKKFIVNIDSNGFSTINTSLPYPQKKYCNVAVATQNEEAENREYLEFEADRIGTGVCFYLLYFLDCLFRQLGIAVRENNLPKVEDMNRLAFFSTVCDYTIEENIPGGWSLNQFGVSKATATRTSSGLEYSLQGHKSKSAMSLTSKMFATSKNFPNTQVSEVLDGLKSAFGVIFLYNERYKEIKLLFVRDILRDEEIRTICAQIHESVKVENNIVGFELSYSSGDNDNTSFTYNDYSQVNTARDYSTIRKYLDPYDETLYIDQSTGDAFRIKIDEEALEDQTKELNPTLFEVAEFCPAQFGDCSNEEQVEKKEITFTPIIANDISKEEGVSQYTIYIDASMGKYETQNETITSKGDYGMALLIKPPEDSEAGGDEYISAPFDGMRTSIIYDGYSYSATSSSNGSPINQYDPGFTLGILRPGTDEQIVETDHNYDGEGNIKYYFVSSNSAFISDTMDHYGNVYDYNGSDPGGVSQEGRFSLKLRAEKPNPEGGFYPITNVDAQRRGLFDKFYTEYAYFVVNRKIVKMVCRMEMADVLNIDWTKRYKIGDYTGFINKYSYTVDSTGMSDVTLEMYYI